MTQDKKNKGKEDGTLSINIGKEGVQIKGPGIEYKGDGSLINMVLNLGAEAVKDTADVVEKIGTGACDVADKIIDKTERVISAKKGDEDAGSPD